MLDSERPARGLTGRVGAGVAVVAFVVAVLVLWQVFRPGRLPLSGAALRDR